MNGRVLPESGGFCPDLADYSRSDPGPQTDTAELDALIVGAGFSGIFMLKTLRDRGYRVVVYEAGNDTGGTWRWNAYPGAAVDSQVPEYEFSWPEVWKTWDWTTNYPGYKELRAYFDHVDKVLDVKKDCSFNTIVTGAEFDVHKGRWNVATQDGRNTTAKSLILGTGFSAKRYVPDWPGINNFKGTIHHSSFWPDRDIDVQGKRCAVIGTGASGVQIVQAWGPVAGELKVFQRTPNLAVPMRRRSLGAEEQGSKKASYPQLFMYREKTFAGFHFDWFERNALDETAEERQRLFEETWAAGGFHFWLSIYKNTLTDAAANTEAYNFWAHKTRPRVKDARKRDLLAPLDMPHFFGIKRPCLEHSYYEQFNQPSVDVVDVRSNPIERFTETGITLKDGTHHKFDVIAIATGFDVVTGGMTQLGLKSIDNTRLDEEWSHGTSTYLGTTVSGYPNMFHLYGAHGPTLLSNGPSCIELQGRWIADCIDKMQRDKIKHVNPKREAARAWKQKVVEINNTMLFPTTQSTYMGGNAPGKPYEPVCFPGGLAAYTLAIRTALDSMEGFDVVYE
ncbi:flavin-binding monooxygenase-like domain-containing protein [Hirsutella rhossiliensis]|uniref:Flavin-binding monooxygenase-like domain-containing protein n=1 Tax=Hirsutella rhossiliensis TaxID=111463 RepID=A0A9P8SJ00_9HYPO|nr:flavin-binding monooxygenase-like domain-containing protein [Hirsutella rhossiliensis]KAH0964758.1 flavin-binding monooxygenase-like domain-containing protein [Hirsutella rhossiliensis]